MTARLPRFVPADEPGYYTRGDGLVLKAEFSRTVTITCQACKVTNLPLKLLSNSVLRPDTCDRLLTAYLDDQGWTRLREQGADICPECAETRVQVCDFCRNYTGGHTRTCPTLIPGALR